MRDLTPTQVNELYQTLVGTCQDIDVELDLLFDIPNITELSDDTLEEIDQLMFNCSHCGWWCEAGEAVEGPGDEDICEDCAE